MYKSNYKYLFFAILLTLSLFCGGCSLFGGGKKKVTDGSELSESDVDKRFGSGNIPGAEADGMFKDVHFDYDSSSINDAARQSIESNVQVLQQNATANVTLEGHCDERGTAEYNMALGAERAKAVGDTLASFGIARSRINTISYGEEIPLDTGNNESAWARNRRVHFALRR
jgi:peptidoglycan-associated lipoprotein